MLLNIGYGSIWTYAWRTIHLLARISSDHIQRPEPGTLASRTAAIHPIFRRCIGFLDGSNIVLRDRPKVDPEAYFSRKKNYGFNLQAICDWDQRFIWVSMGHTASAHDSTAFKSTELYQRIHEHFDAEEYILADKAYGLERHIITPYKEPASRQPANRRFNLQHAIPRVKIEHAFGVLKARWPTLYNIPTRIGTDKQLGHRRVMNWTMACIVLHNILHGMKENEDWLANELQKSSQEREHDSGQLQESHDQETNAEAKRTGTWRRNELRDLAAMVHDS